MDKTGPSLAAPRGQAGRSAEASAPPIKQLTRKKGVSKGEDGPAPSPAVHQPGLSLLALAGRAV